MTTTPIETAVTPGGHWTMGGDRRIHRMGFGSMRLPTTTFHGPPGDRDTALQVLRRAVELGVDHIDTASFYRSAPGAGALTANELIRTALRPYPEQLVIATKVGPVWGDDGSLSEGGPETLRAAVERNLEELGLDRLELVNLRIGGLGGPPGDSIAARFEALAALHEEGLIGHLGLSNVSSRHLAEARRIAPVAAVQNHFNLTERSDAELLAECEREGIAYVPFFPLGGFGLPDDDRLARIAGRHDATVAQVILAWLLALSPAMLAIPGTSSPAHLEENVAAAALRLAPADLAELNAYPGPV